MSSVQTARYRRWQPAGATNMILLTRLNGTRFYLNADHIQAIEETPDTHVVLTNGQLYVTTESALIVAERAIAYQQRVHRPFRRLAALPNDSELPERIDAHRARAEAD